ncbi:MAG: hypothetical protein IJS36_07625 [Kiritimatiellae bacterium]|nr:hypothetical protein [Kiritimatiellia bacterium]
MSGNLTAETIVLCGAALAAFSACAAVSLDAPGHVYVEGDAPVARGGVPDSCETAPLDWCDLNNWRRNTSAAPLDSWETRRVHLPRDCSLADVTSIRLGANPKGGRCTFWVRNLAVLRRKGGSKSK